jgi:hypothetical protein
MSKLIFGMIGGLIGALVLAVAALFGWSSWVNAHRIVAGPDNESSLYRSYDPEQVIKQFRDEHVSYGGGSSCGASQGIISIHHTKDFTPRFTMQANREQEMLHALREDIELRLRAPGLAVVAVSDQADGGFTYKYTSANSTGSISVQLPANYMTVRRYPVPGGLDHVELKIALDETWTRPASETQWWMSAAD